MTMAKNKSTELIRAEPCFRRCTPGSDRAKCAEGLTITECNCDCHKTELTRSEKNRPKGCWLEEFKHCGCSYVAVTKKELMGYCPRHANDRRRVTKLPEPIEVGYAGLG